jgi:hypothetical protein
MPSLSLTEFEASLAAEQPPEGLGQALAALWWQGKGAWERAHALAQAADGAAASWVHAHLHRVEGDLDNAAYWYRRAGRDPASGGLQAEWRAIVQALLAP